MQATTRTAEYVRCLEKLSADEVCVHDVSPAIYVHGLESPCITALYLKLPNLARTFWRLPGYRLAKVLNHRTVEYVRCESDQTYEMY